MAKGWAERNGGNITVNITDVVDDRLRAMPAISARTPIGATLPHLKGCWFYCKGTNRRMRDLARDPMDNGSIIRICDDCASYEIVADKPVKPTSELPSHLSVHNYLIAKGSPYKASVHTHPIELVAMSHNPEFLKKDVLTRLLWSMIPETKAFCPRGLGIVPYMMPSSSNLPDHDQGSRRGLRRGDVGEARSVCRGPRRHGGIRHDRHADQECHNLSRRTSMGFIPDGMTDGQMALRCRLRSGCRKSGAPAISCR